VKIVEKGMLKLLILPLPRSNKDDCQMRSVVRELEENEKCQIHEISIETTPYPSKTTRAIDTDLQ